MPLANDQNATAAFDDLFREYFKPLCAYCQFKFNLDIDVAKDAVHSGFIRLLESDFQISFDAPTRTYLYKIVTNICLDLLRHEKTRQQHQQSIQKNRSVTEDDFTLAEYKELQNNINKAIAELPDQMRQVFELSRFEGLKYAEIADRMEVSVKTVETQISRALVKLRQKLASYLSMYWFLMLVQLWLKK